METFRPEGPRLRKTMSFGSNLLATTGADMAGVVEKGRVWRDSRMGGRGKMGLQAGGRAAALNRQQVRGSGEGLMPTIRNTVAIGVGMGIAGYIHTYWLHLHAMVMSCTSTLASARMPMRCRHASRRAPTPRILPNTAVTPPAFELLTKPAPDPLQREFNGGRSL